MFSRVLVPIDGSLAGYELAERAIDLADRFDATLYVVYVEELAPGFTTRGLAAAPMEITTPEDDDDEEARSHVADMAAEQGVPCRTMTKRGERHMAIINAADDCRADLIVLRSPTRKLWWRLPITTADRVFRQADTSVLFLDG